MAHPNYPVMLHKVQMAFANLRKGGIAAMENCLCCTTCAADATQIEIKQTGCKGGVYWHGQDDEIFQEYGNLMIGFVASDEETVERLYASNVEVNSAEEAEKVYQNMSDVLAMEVAGAAVVELQNHGLKVRWNDTATHRIEVIGLLEETPSTQKM